MNAHATVPGSRQQEDLHVTTAGEEHIPGSVLVPGFFALAKLQAYIIGKKCEHTVCTGYLQFFFQFRLVTECTVPGSRYQPGLNPVFLHQPMTL